MGTAFSSLTSGLLVHQWMTDSVLRVEWSASLPLPDYGRVARDPGAMPGLAGSGASSVYCGMPVYSATKSSSSEAECDSLGRTLRTMRPQRRHDGTTKEWDPSWQLRPVGASSEYLPTPDFCPGLTYFAPPELNSESCVPLAFPNVSSRAHTEVRHPKSTARTSFSAAC